MSTSRVEKLVDPSPEGAKDQGLPWVPLLALATAAFVGILTEALPAGMLPEMSRSLSVSESAMGQALTVYAIASAVTAIPLFALTATWRRKPLLLGAIAAIAVSNLVTAVSPDYLLTMVFRFIGGVAAGLIWALLVEYARRLAPPHLQGRAIAITMGGVPLALSLGIPVGTFLSGFFGWRMTFLLVAFLGVILVGWVLASVPDHVGKRGEQRESVLSAFLRPGVVAVLFVVAAYVLAHNILYTYIATFLIEYEMGSSIGLVLLIFGIASMVSILIVGAQVDRRLRALTITSTILFALGTTLLAVFADSSVLVFVAAALWGLGWGGITTLMQTAVTDAGGDSAQALLVTTWNGFMAGGGAVGGILLELFGPRSFPWSVLLLLVPVLIVVLLARKHAFPAKRPGMA
ncbi:MFS transporter [Nocardiopsis lambiniae]|uniref:MFS transporter n=1 Tax=Nocardiopsis lambiniae TaxID=3075539 RepID=A0ABU2M7L6_9ACTN|nr:MFS transporter [Nocardiopsis sp. DSM 44743]MDT0328658.1 MFS transporter [Nocardiopsis sp. DSM 44743]